MDVVELVGVKLNRDCGEAVANQTSCESCGLHQEDMLVLLVRWAPQTSEFDSRSTHSQTLPDPPDSETVVDNIDIDEDVEYVLVEL